MRFKLQQRQILVNTGKQSFDEDLVPLQSAIPVWRRKLAEWRMAQKTFMPSLAAYIEDEQLGISDEDGPDVLCDSVRMTDLDEDWDDIVTLPTPTTILPCVPESTSPTPSSLPPARPPAREQSSAPAGPPSSCAPTPVPAMLAPTPANMSTPVPLAPIAVSAPSSVVARSGEIKSRINADARVGRPRMEILGLPSDCSYKELLELELSSLAKVEYNLRVSRAYTLLKAVREAVKHVSAYVQVKKNTRVAKRHNLRVQTDINRSRELAARLAQRFNYNMKSIQRLRALLNMTPESASMASKLRPIEQADLQIGNLVTPAPHGERHQSSWIWGVFELTPETRKQPIRSVKAKETSSNTKADTANAVSWEEDGKSCVIRTYIAILKK